MDQIVKRIIGLQESEDGKASPAAAVYLQPEQIDDEKGAHCGACFFFHKPTSQCFLTSPPACNAEHGVCALFLGGSNLWKTDVENKAKPTPMELIQKEQAGYIEEGPTKCASCEYFHGGSCEKVSGKVEAGGCCNFWEADDEP